MSFIVAIDGPAAAGKGTLARALAARFDLAYLDTGALYRATALSVLRSGGNPASEDDAAAAAAALDTALLSDPALRDEATGDAASKVAALPAVRSALLSFQRDFAANPPNGKSGAILDGRDIGTVICPDAPCKLYVTADAETRARRRMADEADAGRRPEFDQVLADVKARDARDAGRSDAPMRRAEDAYLLDTSYLSIEAALEAAADWVSAKMATRRDSLQ